MGNLAFKNLTFKEIIKTLFFSFGTCFPFLAAILIGNKDAANNILGLYNRPVVSKVLCLLGAFTFFAGITLIILEGLNGNL